VVKTNKTAVQLGREMDQWLCKWHGYARVFKGPQHLQRIEAVVVAKSKEVMCHHETPYKTHTKGMR
jgi:hypothetical protein